MADENITDQAPGLSSQVEEQATQGVARTQKVADDFVSNVSAGAEKYRDEAEHVWSQAKDRAETFRQNANQYVRKNPTKAVFTALGIGFALGVIFRR